MSNKNPFDGWTIIDTYTADDAEDDGYLASLKRVMPEAIPADWPPQLGRIMVTPMIMEQMTAADIKKLLAAHSTCNWGELDAEDWAANDAALVDGSRLFSSYPHPKRKVWIITDGTDDDGRRRNTTIMLPEEY